MRNYIFIHERRLLYSPMQCMVNWKHAMSIEKLKLDIESREEARLKAKQGSYTSKNCIAANLGECLKERYHSIVDGAKRPLADTWLQARFEEGNEQERKLLIKLMSNGFDIVNNQQRFEILDRNKRVILTGRIEGKVKYEGKYYPFEIKSMNPNIYAGIDKLEDFQKYSHTARYPKQLMSYMFSENVDEGFFLITDCLGHFKIIPIKLDYDMMEKEMQNCTLVMDHVENKEPPEFTNNKALCRKCWACKVVCFPDMQFGEGVIVVDDEELSADLKRRDEIQGLSSEYDKLDKKIKDRVKSSYKHAIVGNFEIQVKTSPVNYKAQEARTIQVTKVSIDKIESEITAGENAS